MMDLGLRALIWDIDGVLVYVGASYRRAIIEATDYYLSEVIGLRFEKNILSLADTQKFKLSGGFNNDWEITYAAVLCYLASAVHNIESGGGRVDSIKDLSGYVLGDETEPDLDLLLALAADEGGGLVNLLKVLGGVYAANLTKAKEMWDTDLIKRIFQEMYLGRVLFEEKYGILPKYYDGAGFMADEKPLIGGELLGTLSKRYLMGIASGREHFEIDAVLGYHGFNSFFRREYVVGSDDYAVGKPDPAQLLECKKRMEKKQGVIPGNEIAYLGDVPDDAVAAERAGFRFIGVTASIPDDGGKRDLRERFSELGAEFVVDGLSELKKII